MVFPECVWSLKHLLSDPRGGHLCRPDQAGGTADVNARHECCWSNGKTAEHETDIQGEN